MAWESPGCLSETTLATLAASRFILPKRLQKRKGLRDLGSAQRALESITRKLQFLEPTQEEIAWAAEIELIAQRNGAAFDVGESQLLAILIHRGAQLFITGDKRAIAALASLSTYKPEIQSAAGRIACLEQLMMRLLSVLGGKALQQQICREPNGDRALTNCFSCTSGQTEAAQFVVGLTSYIVEIRAHAGEMLCADGFVLPVSS